MINNPHQIGQIRLEVGVQPPFEFHKADGTSIGIKRMGRGVPVVCLHATGHGGRDYEAFAQTIASRGFEAITLDWPGQGGSPFEETHRTASAERYADILEALMPQLVLAELPIIVGNSIGGASALIFALRHPEQVRALVLCDPGGLAPVNRLAKIVIGMMVGFFSAGARGARWFPPAFAAYYRRVLPEKPAADQRRRIVRAGFEVAPVLRQTWDSFRAPEADLREFATQLRVPVLFAWAKKDQIVAWSRSKQAVKNIPGAEVQLFNAGHAAFLEDPAAFNQAFFSFAEKHRR